MDRRTIGWTDAGNDNTPIWLKGQGVMNYWSFWSFWINYETEDLNIPLPGAQLVNDDIIKWKHFPRYWPFVWGIHRSPVNSPHKGQWRGALMFSLICAWTNGRVNNRDAGDLRRHPAHYDVTAVYTTKGHLVHTWTDTRMRWWSVLNSKDARIDID